MINPILNVRTATIHCLAAAAQTLPEQAIAVLGAEILNNNAAAGAVLTGNALAAVVAAPGGAQIQFLGTAIATSNQVTLNAAPVAGTVMFVKYIPQGAIPAAA